MNQLYGCAKDKLTLQEAIVAWLPLLPAMETVALLYTPSRCTLALLEGRELRQSNGQAVSLDDVFEARVFNERAELRWLNQRDGKGRAVLLSDEAFPDDWQKALTEEASRTAITTLEQTYLLWGEGIEPGKSRLPPSWSRLTTARIGKLDVPIAGVGKGGRVHLKVKEYLDVCDLHGNVAVVEERLLKLEVA